MGIMFNTPTFDPLANNGPLLVRMAIAMMALSFTGVCLRLLSRRLVHQPLLRDDWMIVVALPFSWAICGVEILGVKNGNLGRHIGLATKDNLEHFFKYLYAIQLLYVSSIALTKWSIIAFYRHLFDVKRTKIPLIILDVVIGAWVISTVLVGILSCLPLHHFWDRTTSTGRCINTSVYFMASAGIYIPTEIIILLFPIPIIWKLQIFQSQKFSIVGIFLLGGFIVVISCLRLSAIIMSRDDPDITWAFLPLAIWSIVETNFAIFCACIPCMQPLLRVLRRKSGHNKTYESNMHFGGRTRKRWWPRKTSMPMENSANLLYLSDNPEENSVHGTRTVVSATGTRPQNLEMTARDGIYVESTVAWT